MTTKDTPTTCRCGCGETMLGRRSVFRPGHDARFAGRLIAAVRAKETTPARAIATARKVSEGMAAKVERGVKR